jgi:SAM-dependent methyltransferase
MPRQVSALEHAELQRIQAQVWAPSAEALFDRIGVRTGWKCLDVGCGPLGVLPELSRRVGPSGRVIGLDCDPHVMRLAHRAACEQRLANVEIVAGDLNASPLRRRAFDLVHLRFVLHVPSPVAAIAEIAALARPGGWVAIEEPDLSTWRYLPPCAAWPRLLALLQGAIARRAEPNVGSRLAGMMAQAGMLDLQSRAVVLVLRERHPYMRLPLFWVESEREEIVAAGLASEGELSELVRALERHVWVASTMMLTFTTIQAWGRTTSPR